MNTLSITVDIDVPQCDFSEGAEERQLEEAEIKVKYDYFSEPIILGVNKYES